MTLIETELNIAVKDISLNILFQIWAFPLFLKVSNCNLKPSRYN